MRRAALIPRPGLPAAFDARPLIRLGLGGVGHAEFVRIAMLLALQRDTGRARWQLTLDSDAQVRVVQPGVSPVSVQDDGGGLVCPLPVPLQVESFDAMLRRVEAAVLGPAEGDER